MAVIPRICDISNKPICPSDNKSIQVTICGLDNEGRINNEIKIFDFSGKMRRAGKIDEAINDFIIKTN